MKITELIQHIDPAKLDYQQWVAVGMALKDAGHPCSVWNEWSRPDERFKNGECFKKWDGFRGSATPVTEGTIVKLARDQGWQPPAEGGAMEWDDIINERPDYQVVDTHWVEDQEVEAPTDWQPTQQLATYLQTLFQGEEHVAYTITTYEQEGRQAPTKGVYHETAGELLSQLSEANSMEDVFGTINETAGAWIRFNPLDGRGVRDSNVTDFRFALVESDDESIERQRAIYDELELPIAALVHSGNKSLHAIVRIDAADKAEYQKRVDFLYGVCKKNGLEIDRQNRNPSRLSRMPGIMRGDKKQFLVATNIGQPGWKDWREWIESVNDDLPDPECLADVWNNIPPLADPLIDGILRQGHKMLLAGPSKAGKSFALIELCVAIAEGRQWLGRQCAQGRGLYVNLELDRASCLHRFRDVYKALEWMPDNFDKIDVWNLRGQAVPMDRLAPKLIRRAHKKDYIAIVIDPIYKVITGDENAADKMAAFCNQFDKVCHELGAAVIYCHHHSKGAQGGKRSMDRASGSGVFARDPDALLDLIELEVPETTREQQVKDAAVEALHSVLAAHLGDWRAVIDEADHYNPDELMANSMALLGEVVYRQEVVPAVARARRAAKGKTAWRVDGTMREFARFEPVNIWFDYPIHRVDDGPLKDAQPESAAAPWERAGRAKASNDKARKGTRWAELDNAFGATAEDGQVHLKDLAAYMDLSGRTIRERVNDSNLFTIKKGVVSRVSETEGGTEKQSPPPCEKSAEGE